MAAADRITAPVDPNRTTRLAGRVPRGAQPQYDQGPVDPSMPIQYATLLMTPAPGLDTLLADQQNPSSADYHRWLTPEQFGSSFGLSANDVAKVTGWLQSQGLTVNDVARGRNWITFSGTAQTVGRALSTEFHHYRVNGELHFANTANPSIPAALAGVVASIEGLTDFGLQPAIVQPVALPDYNSGSSHYIAPDDFATIYDVAPLYAAGIDGTGQKLAVVGQSDINLGDIRTFRQKFNLAVKDPQLVLYGPDPGTVAGAETEADLDLEWSGAIARNAGIVYVYSKDVNLSAQYAIDQRLAPVLSMSFIGCELDNSPALRALAQQANAEGITMIAASGDWGAATCDASSPTQQASKGVSVGSPASFPEVTAIGGTTLVEGTGNYWAPGNGPNGGSALSYIPEKAWDDAVDFGDGLEASGGGPSAVFPKPSWQAGPGVPSDNARDIPDLSFTASPNHDPYLFVSSGQLYVVGGTSGGTPAFAGIATLLNQYLVSKNIATQAGLGNVNPMLYRLAQSTTDVFHDVTNGSNDVPCEQGTASCVNRLLGFAAGPAYDRATGLGSVDASHLVHEWTTGTSSTTTLTANPSNYGLSDTVQLTATVAGGGSAAPTGTVTFLANDNSLGTATLAPVNGAASATLGAPGLLIAGGNGTVSALYSGDGVYNASGATAAVTLNLPSTGSLVVPSITPTVVSQSANIWPFTITLTEKAGVATRLTQILENGVSQSLGVFASTAIPAKGSISANVYEAGLTPPVNLTFQFSGVDASGRAWSQSITVPFAGPPGPAFIPSMTLTAAPAEVQQNPNAETSCQWAQQLTLQETSGFLELLSSFHAQAQGFGNTTTDLSDQIQAIFGTTRLAPYGTLRGTLCLPGAQGTSQILAISGASEIGSQVSAAVETMNAAPAVHPAAMSVSPAVVEMLADPLSQVGTGIVNLHFDGRSPQWSVSIAGHAPWLSVSPVSGAGNAQLTLQASAAGLSSGAYDATLTIQSSDVLPQAISVRVVFVTGGSNTTIIAGVSSAAAPSVVFAPGMLASVYGSNLAPSEFLANHVPLSFNLGGVSATVNGISAPLDFVSPGQINLQIPYETSAGLAVLAVNNNGQIASYILPINVSAPELFISPQGFLIPTPSAHAGDTIFAYMTGEGDVAPFLATGNTPASGTAVKNLPAPLQPVSITVGGAKAAITFAGIAPGLVGVTQINFTIPRSVASGVQPVVVTVGGASSSGANLRIE